MEYGRKNREKIFAILCSRSLPLLCLPYPLFPRNIVVPISLFLFLLLLRSNGNFSPMMKRVFPLWSSCSPVFIVWSASVGDAFVQRECLDVFLTHECAQQREQVASARQSSSLAQVETISLARLKPLDHGLSYKLDFFCLIDLHKIR